MYKIYLFDWGNTIMKDYTDESGSMYTWTKVSAMPNAEKVLQKLSKNTRCYIATNAKDSNKEEIIKALQRVNLDTYFSDIFCYREIGYSKPTKEYFQVVLDKTQARKEDIVMIGDNIENDVQGAVNFGIDALLYDPENQHPKYSGKRITNLMNVIK